MLSATCATLHQTWFIECVRILSARNVWNMHLLIIFIRSDQIVQNWSDSFTLYTLEPALLPILTTVPQLTSAPRQSLSSQTDRH